VSGAKDSPPGRGLGQWWALVLNEARKFRQRRRAWIGLGAVVVLAMVLGSVAQRPPGDAAWGRTFALETDRQVIGDLVAQIPQSHGTVRMEDEAELLRMRYDLAAVGNRPLPPLQPMVRATDRWMRAVERSAGTNPIPYSDAVQAWQQERYALAHHLPLEPSWVPPSGLFGLSQVFRGAWVLLLTLVVVGLAADVLGMEWSTGTWNRLWLEPASRGQVLLAKATLSAGVAAGALLLAAALIYAAGAVRFGSGVNWVTLDAHYQVVSRLPSGVVRGLAVVRGPGGAAGTTLLTSDIGSVLGTLLPVAAVAAVAALLGYAVAQPSIATLMAAAFATVPLLLTPNAPPWLEVFPGTYLAMGRLIAGSATVSATMPGMGVRIGLVVSAGWVALAWGAAWWHQRRAEL
jgi:hypothetical protein